MSSPTLVHSAGGTQYHYEFEILQEEASHMHLGLDLGTSGLKALIMDDQHQVVTVKTMCCGVAEKDMRPC